MSYSFEYIDIILLAMIAGFIFLRLRGILGKKTGFDENINSSFNEKVQEANTEIKLNSETFDEKAKKEFLKGAQIAYETIVTGFSKGTLKDIKSLLDIKVYDQFNKAIDERKQKNFSSETTFIGINSAEIKHHEQNKNMLEVTVEFVSEIISCIKDKENKIVSGDPEKIKKVSDVWKFSKDSSSTSPNWLLIDTQAQLTNKLTDKDKKDWDNFLKGDEKIENKDKELLNEGKKFIEKTIDLHGYTLEDANRKIFEYIENCHLSNVDKINVITGKGLRSKNVDDPYQSNNLSILKYSVPNFIKNKTELMKKISKIDFESVNSPSKGSFEIFLNKKK